MAVVADADAAIGTADAAVATAKAVLTQDEANLGYCTITSTVEGNNLTYDQEVAKLRLVVETATEVWG